MNWTALIMTFMICGTAMIITDRMKSIARTWLEGIRAIRDTEAMRHGYKPNGK